MHWLRRIVAPRSLSLDVFLPIFTASRTGELESSGRPSPFSSRAPRGLASAAGHGLVLSSRGAGRRLDGGLLSVAEVAAAIFQSEKWEGTS